MYVFSQVEKKKEHKQLELHLDWFFESVGSNYETILHVV